MSGKEKTLKGPKEAATTRTVTAKGGAEGPKTKTGSAKGLRGKGAGGGAKPGSVLAELLALLPELDEEGLAFLLEQAHVHRYNMEVERLNAAAERAESAAEKRKGSAGRKVAAGAGSVMRLERSSDGMTYHVVSGGKWKMFSAEEMASLVRLTRSGDDRGTVIRRIFSWLDRERRDALDDLGMVTAQSPALAELLDLLAASFPVRPGRPNPSARR